MTDQSSRKLIIAIDGPAGAGKSTIASRLARKLGYINLESGAMYRALALKAIEWDISFEDEAALLKLAQNSRIQLEPSIGGNRVLLDGHDISSRIRERDVTEAASRVSVHPKVREWMVTRQRELGERDLRDRTRVTSPLVPASDAVILDSTSLSEDEVLRRAEALVRQRME